MERIAAIAAIKLTFYLKNRISEEKKAGYGKLLNEEAAEDFMQNFTEIPENIYHDVTEHSVTYIRYERLYDLLRGNGLALTLLQLSVCSFMMPEYLKLYHDICTSCTAGPTMELACKIWFGTDQTASYYADCREAWNRCRWLFPEARAQKDFLHAICIADDRLISYLAGVSGADVRLENIVSEFNFENELGEWYGTSIEESQFKLKSLFTDYGLGNTVVSVSGAAHSGRKFLAKHIAAANKLNLLMVDYDKLMVQESSPLMWRLILREIFLNYECLCVYGITADEESRSGVCDSVVKLSKEALVFGKPVFLLTGTEIKLIPLLDANVAEFKIKPYNSAESRIVWNKFLDKYGLSDIIDSKTLSLVMNLPAGQTDKICRLCAISRAEGTYKDGDIFKICYKVLDDGRYDNIKRVEGGYTWDDLKIDDNQRALLESICAQVEYRAQIFDDWKLQKNYRYGKSVSAIFTGPPGTGKTMAAGVLANRLGLEIYKIDLSQVVDKYIGETEKKLEEVFKKAEKSHMILFFDEADAILGKRSEVKDSKDKYANTEVSYLLQRMEEYDGIVLMATNNRSNIDPAFIRRFRFEVPFYQPDEGKRKEIWEMLLDAEIPSRDIDIDFMAKTFEITGAVIKNIVLNACFDAAGAGGVLTMEILIGAAIRELKKNGKVVIASDLKQYDYIL